MEEDPNIDIDENTLIYPRIENIYSDVNIKAESIDIDEDEYDSVEIEQSSSDYYMAIPNKIILGSKPSTLAEPVPGPSAASDGWDDQESFFECTECNSMYPTQNELDSHKMASHSFLVARPMSRVKNERRISVSSTSSRSYIEETNSQDQIVRRQKAVKSTAKSALNKTFPGVKAVNKLFGDITPVALKKDTEMDGLVCKHCDVRFPDEIALIKHTYELLPASKFEPKFEQKFEPKFAAKFECKTCNATFDSQMSLKGHMANHFKKYALSPTPIDNTETMLQCEYCSCFLMLPGFMKKHLLKNHKTTEYAVKRVKFSGVCAICEKPVIGYKKYNLHLLKCHRKIFMSKTPYRFETTPVKMKCSLCSQIFPSRYAAYKHKAEKHPEFSQKHTFHTVYDKPIKQLPMNPPNSSSVPQAFKPKIQVPKYSIGNKTFIPKQNLFKCNKCQIHFVSCSVAFAHSKRCSLAKGDWKCSKCRRSFTKGEIALHTQQHQVSEKFKVHIVCDKILSKVLCRCPKCELLFDEIAFGEHISADCVPQNGVECKSCDLKIHSDSFAKHRRLHNKYNFSSGSFILIDFVDQTAPVKDDKKSQLRQKLIFCSTCKCHFYTTRSKKAFHMNKKCVSLDKKCCARCGLTFSKKPFVTHGKLDHDLHDLKLDDYKFVRIQDMKVIRPVMPDFFHCKHCDVRFISIVTLGTHTCSKQEFVKCSKCSRKFESTAYDIHLTFHNYGKSKVEDRNGPTQKFYSCIACNYGFHSYDSIVDHSQKHLINTEELATKYCKVCKLNYAGDHKAHSGRSNFEIFNFDSEKLLTDDWLNGFGELSTDVIEEIKSRSVYGAMRNVRLELLVEGPAERTLYKCAQCELNFDQDYVVDHITETCSNTPRFECSSCSAAFKTRLARNNHMNVHVVYGDDITFRELVFNKEEDKELNDALRTGKQKESLKFRKCQQCKLLIKKSEYQSHVKGHDKDADDKIYRIEIKTFTFRRTKARLTYKLFKPLHVGKKLYTVFKCRTCKACIMQKHNMIRHKCGAVDKYEKCSKCSQYILAWNLKRHIEQHALIPKFVPKNILVIEFQLLDNNEVKKRRYSSDDDASSSEVNVTVSKKYDTRKVVGRPYSDNLSEESQDNTDNASLETSTRNTYAKRYIKRSIDTKVESDNESEASTQIETIKTDLAESTLDIDKWRIEMKNKLYQCEKCYMCYSHRQLLVNHLVQCKSLSETPLFCNQCDMVFHPSLTSFHEKLHDLVRRNPVENYFYLINISTNGRHTNMEQRWLYSCKPCDINYLCIKSLARHFTVGHSALERVRCEICDLQFSKKSRKRHVRVQHEAGLNKEDFHFEITHRKIVGVNEFRLTDFDNSVNENSVIEEITDETMADSVTREDNNKGRRSVLNTESFNDDSVSVDEKQFELNEVSDLKKIDNTLYKCSICSNHYFSKHTLLRHMDAASHKMKASQCDLCGLLFNRRTLLVHKSKQHREMKLGLKDFVIIDSTQIENEANVVKTIDLKEDLDDKENLKEDLNDKDLKEDLNDKDLKQDLNDKDLEQDLNDKEDLKEELNDKVKIIVPEEYKEVSSKLKNVRSGPIDNHIYKCVVCSIYYTNRCTLLLHIILKKHKHFEFSKCDLCGFMFGKGSLLKHKKIQHGELKLTRKDFIITDVFGLTLADDGSDSINHASSINTDDKPLIKIEDKVSKDKVKAKDVKIKLYQCNDCGICIRKAETKLHVCCSDIRKKQCIYCCLSFRNTDVRQHQRLHRNYRGLSRKNFTVIRFGRPKNNKIYKCVSCSTHFMGLMALEWHMSIDHKTKRECCKHCGLYFGKYNVGRHQYIHHTKLNLTVEQLNIIYVSDKVLPVGSKENVADKNMSSEPEATSNEKIVKKLFKCSECDVYFLTRTSYYHHIYKHRKLDSTEFIDCNICDFQFLNESLGVHMKTHKDKSFFLDKLLIEEYQSNGADAPKIDVYFAKDSLNSKLVSTTTLFDNDDEVSSRTDEQLSVIDSTSDELPKAKTAEVIVEANTFPSNDTVCEERDLNPIVEVVVVNVDVSK